jgi:hypothetical protein
LCLLLGEGRCGGAALCRPVLRLRRLLTLHGEYDEGGELRGGGQLMLGLGEPGVLFGRPLLRGGKPAMALWDCEGGCPFPETSDSTIEKVSRAAG